MLSSETIVSTTYKLTISQYVGQHFQWEHLQSTANIQT